MQTQMEQADMSRRRALLTDRERELIADEEAENPRYVAASHIRAKVQDELPRDLELLQEHHPILYRELREVVCEKEEVGDDETTENKTDNE